MALDNPKSAILTIRDGGELVGVLREIEFTFRTDAKSIVEDLGCSVAFATHRQGMPNLTCAHKT